MLVPLNVVFSLSHAWGHLPGSPVPGAVAMAPSGLPQPTLGFHVSEGTGWIQRLQVPGRKHNHAMSWSVCDFCGTVPRAGEVTELGLWFCSSGGWGA